MNVPEIKGQKVKYSDNACPVPGFHYIGSKPQIMYVENASYKHGDTPATFGTPLLTTIPVPKTLDHDQNYHHHFAIYNIIENDPSIPMNDRRRGQCLICKSVLVLGSLQPICIHIKQCHLYLCTIEDIDDQFKKETSDKWTAISTSTLIVP
jgi:hypothetical protein